jgi:hypothetical protein
VKNARSSSCTWLASNNHRIADGLAESFIGDLGEIAPQYGVRGRPGVTFELRRARHLNVLVIADDIHHGIGPRFLGTLLKVDQGG